MYFIRYISVGLLFIAINWLKAQSQSSISFDAHGGFIMVHRYNMRHLVQNHIAGAELSWGKTLFNDSLYNQLYNFPEKGVSLYFSNLGNPVQLGNVWALIPYMNIPLNSLRSLYLKSGLGMGYFPTTFHQQINNLNNVISSHLTVCINAQLQKNWNISKYFELYQKVGMTHFSNGAYKMPNLGINLVTASLGIRFHQNIQPQIKRFNKNSIEFSRKAQVEAGISSGIKEVGGPGGMKYVIFNTNIAYVYPISFKSEFLIWGDLFHDRSLEIRLAGENWRRAVTSDFIQSGLMGGYRIRYNKLSFMLAMGAYTFTKYKGLGSIYHRVGIRYKINDKIGINVTLKSHFAIADFSEWGIVYLLK